MYFDIGPVCCTTPVRPAAPILSTSDIPHSIGWIGRTCYNWLNASKQSWRQNAQLQRKKPRGWKQNWKRGPWKPVGKRPNASKQSWKRYAQLQRKKLMSCAGKVMSSAGKVMSSAGKVMNSSGKVMNSASKPLHSLRLAWISKASSTTLLVLRTPHFPGWLWFRVKGVISRTDTALPKIRLQQCCVHINITLKKTLKNIPR